MPQKTLPVAALISIVLTAAIALAGTYHTRTERKTALSEAAKQEYWMLLYRKSEREFLYFGVPGDAEKSALIREFAVKVGRPGERPTPLLPRLAGREYWNLIARTAVRDNPETAPYFLTLDIPSPEEPPYGPVPYLECGGEQCDWVTHGEFGLHGVNGRPEKLSAGYPGSSGCVRHRDEDIAYLYNLLRSEESPVRYYIEDM